MQNYLHLFCVLPNDILSLNMSLILIKPTSLEVSYGSLFFVSLNINCNLKKNMQSKQQSPPYKLINIKAFCDINLVARTKGNQNTKWQNGNGQDLGQDCQVQKKNQIK